MTLNNLNPLMVFIICDNLPTKKLFRNNIIYMTMVEILYQWYFPYINYYHWHFSIYLTILYNVNCDLKVLIGDRRCIWNCYLWQFSYKYTTANIFAVWNTSSYVSDITSDMFPIEMLLYFPCEKRLSEIFVNISNNHLIYIYKINMIYDRFYIGNYYLW